MYCPQKPCTSQKDLYFPKRPVLPKKTCTVQYCLKILVQYCPKKTCTAPNRHNYVAARVQCTLRCHNFHKGQNLTTVKNKREKKEMTNIAILSIPFHPVMNSFCPGERGKKTSSRLVIANVERSDSGNYSCTTDTALPSTIVVFVSDGK